MVAKRGLHGDVRLAYTLKGAGPTTVLIHGWACNRRFWKEQIPALARSHRVLALDLRGHGDSEVPDHGYTLSQLAEDVHTLIGDIGLGPVTVVGHSMGGMVAQEMALSYPDDLSALVLVATTAADPEHTLISKRIADNARELGFRAAFLREFPGWFSPNASRELVEWAKEQMLLTPERVALDLSPIVWTGRLSRAPSGSAGPHSSNRGRRRRLHERLQVPGDCRAHPQRQASSTRGLRPFRAAGAPNRDQHCDPEFPVGDWAMSSSQTAASTLPLFSSGIVLTVLLPPNTIPIKLFVRRR